MPKPRLTENHIELQVTAFLRLRGWRVERRQSGLFSRPWGDGKSRIRIGEVGLADWQASRPVHDRPGLVEFLYLEVKAPGKRLRIEQRQWLESRRAEGFIAHVTDSLTEFEAWYKRRFATHRPNAEEVLSRGE